MNVNSVKATASHNDLSTTATSRNSTSNEQLHDNESRQSVPSATSPLSPLLESNGTDRNDSSSTEEGFENPDPNLNEYQLREDMMSKFFRRSGKY